MHKGHVYEGRLMKAGSLLFLMLYDSLSNFDFTTFLIFFTIAMTNECKSVSQMFVIINSVLLGFVLYWKLFRNLYSLIKH